MISNYKTYIILINYGNWQDTIECIKSINKSSQNFKLILVDIINKNHSIEELRKNINFDKENIHFIMLDQNKGFAYANNIGIKYALKQDDCEYIWLLNNDTTITNSTLQQLQSFFQRNKNTAFIGSKILDYYKRDIIQTVGGKFNHKTGYSILIGMGEKDIGQYDNFNENVDYLIGAGMFFHKNLISEIGLMPEEYFLYYEDVDWCLTAKKKGLNNYVCTDSVIYHKQGGSTGNIYFKNKTNLNTVKYFYINYIKLYKKHFPKQIYIAYLILLKQFAGKIAKGKFSEANIILKSLFK